MVAFMLALVTGIPALVSPGLSLSHAHVQLTRFWKDDHAMNLAQFDWGSLGRNVHVEQVVPEIRGAKAIIHNAVMTVDTSFLHGMDFKDPVFSGCSMVFHVANGVPDPIGPATGKPVHGPGVQGFLYFNSSSPPALDTRVPRIASIIGRHLGIEIKTLRSITSSFEVLVPFIGASQASPVIQQRVFRNILHSFPRDGTFTHLVQDNEPFLLDALYLESRHARATVAFIDGLHRIEAMQRLMDARANMSSPEDYPFFTHASALVRDNPVLSSVLDVRRNAARISFKFPPGATGDFLDVFDDDDVPIQPAVVQQAIDALNDIVLIDLVHEPVDDSWCVQDGDARSFSLHRVLGMPASTGIVPGERTTTSILGWMSGPGIILHEAEITSMNPSVFEIDQDRAITWRYALFFAHGDTSHQSFFDGRFRVAFTVDGTVGRLASHFEPVHGTRELVLDVLGHILPGGIPVIPSALVGAVHDLTITWKDETIIPSLQIIKTLGYSNASIDEPTAGVVPRAPGSNELVVPFTITITNDGNASAWGVPVHALEKYGLKNAPPAGVITNALRTLGHAPESMFSNETPRYFPVDPFGNGLFTGFHPSLVNISQTMPHSTEYSDTILDNIHAIATITGLQHSYIREFASRYNKTSSIFNPANWVIEPGHEMSLFYSQALQVPPDVAIAINETTVMFHETLHASSMRYASRTAYAFFSSHSNELVITMEKDLLANFSRIKQVVTSFSRLVFDTVSNQGHREMHVSIINWGEIPLHNVTVDIPRLGWLCDNETRFSQRDHGSWWQASLPHLEANSTTSLMVHFLPGTSLAARTAIISWQRNVSLNPSSEENDTRHAEVSTNPVIPNHHAFRPALAKVEIIMHVASMPDLVTDGTSITIIYALRNAGDVIVSNITVSTVPGLMIMSGITCTESTLANNTIGTLATGENVTWSVEHVVEDATTAMLPPLLISFPGMKWVAVEPASIITLGIVDLHVTRSSSTSFTLQGDHVTMHVRVTNKGTAPVASIMIDDSLSHDMTKFTLVQGSFHAVIPRLEPGAHHDHVYTLRVDGWGSIVIKPCVVRYTQLSIETRQSEETTIIILPTYLLITAGSIIAFVSTSTLAGRRKLEARRAPLRGMMPDGGDVA